MTKLPYLRTMFATCMLFQVTYVLCVILWLAFPDLKGHESCRLLFPVSKSSIWRLHLRVCREHGLRVGRCDHLRLLLQSLAATRGCRSRTAGGATHLDR